MPPKLYGTEHIVYIVCALAVTVAVVLTVRFCAKTDKQKTIALKIIAGVLLVFLVMNRVSLAVWKKNALQLLPNSYCGMTSLLLAVAVLAGKPHNKLYDFLFYIELVGGTATIFYPNFLSQYDTFWFLPTVSGLLHHTVGLLLCILLAVCGWFRPSLKRWKMFPIGLSVYTLYGLFLLDVCKIPETMQIDTPIIPNTPLYWWFMLTVGSAAVFVFLLVWDLVEKRVKKNAAKKSDTAADKVDGEVKSEE